MAAPSEGPHRVPMGLANRIDECFPAALRDLAAAGPGHRVRMHTAGEVVILGVDGRLTDVVEDLDHAIRLALAELPRGVACDLSAVQECAAPGALRVLASAGRHLRDWPGIPVAVASPDASVRDDLRRKPLGGHLLVTESVRLALSTVLETAAPVAQSLRLAPHPTAPRASRDFVSRTLLDWQLGPRIPTACLVVSELVTNAMVHAGTDIDLSLAAHRGILRVTVRDHGAGLPLHLVAPVGLHGRGLAVVAGLSRGWGVLPTAGGGKVVWAVIDSSGLAA